MLRYLKHAEIDFARWDQCVKQSVQHLIYAYAGYLEISTAGKWDAIVEMQDGAYVSVFPLPYKKRLGIYYIYQPFHSQQLGLFTTSQSREVNVASFLSAIPEHFRKIYLQLNTANTVAIREVPAGFSVGERLNYHLELHIPAEEIKKNFPTSLRRKIRRAFEHDLVVTKSQKIGELINLFRKTRGAELGSVKTRHYLLFEKQYRFLKKSNLAEVLEIRKSGQLLAGALFLKQAGKIIFLFSGLSEEGRKMAAMPFILDSVIREHAGKDIVLDFEGGSIESLKQFYSSFGAKPVTYLSVSKSNLPRYLQWLIK